MRRLATYLLTLLLAFVIGVAVFKFYRTHLVSGLSNCEILPTEEELQKYRDENNIAEAVFRYQIQYQTLSIKQATFFLCVGPDNNPRDEIIEHLHASGYVVRKILDIGLTGRPTYDNFDYYYSEVILRVGDIHWKSDGEVIVGGSYRQWMNGNEQVFVYRLIREGSDWKVVQSELIS